MGGYYNPRRGSSYYQPDRIVDLIMERGRIQAEGAARSGELWGQTVAGLGQQIGGAVQEAGKASQLKKRDAAWLSYLDSGEWMKDPKAAYVNALKVWGPEDGPRQFQGLMGAAQLMGEKRDPEQDAKAAGVIIGAMDRLTDEGRAQLWPQAVGLVRSRFPEVQLSEEYNPEQWPTISAMGPGLRGEKPPEGYTLGTNEVRYDAAGKEVARGPAAQPMQHGDGLRVVGRSLVGADGKVVYRDPEAPKEPRDERLVQIMGPNGTPVWVRESEAVGKPAAQAPRAVTGQERQALAYFNRAQKAIEDISATDEADTSLEDRVAKAGIMQQGRLQYAPNWAQSPENQAYRQAQRAFTEARLRKESGAAIPTAEYENDARTYFAQPGDSKETIDQKRKARQVVLEGLRFGAGKAYEEYYGEPAPTPADSKKAAAPAPAAPPAPSGKAPRRMTRAEYEKAPSGTEFIAPDGSIRRKP
jgi:hypothetical protein